MKLFKTLKAYLTNKLKRFPKDIPYPIEEAFSIEGRTFYRYKDYFNIPYERGLKTITFYEEARMKITYEYLEEHIKAIDKILKSQKIDVYKIKALNDIMAERMKWAVDTEILYKLASIVFFEKDEDPRTYDFKHNAEKIEFWKEHKSVSDFFLQTPLLELMPFLKELDTNLETYSLIAKELTKHHLDLVSSIVSEK
jgi:hypothetical protein